MNIKSITGNVIPAEIKKVDKRAQDTSADRDPTPQNGDSKPEYHKLTDEELEAALNFLKNLKGVQDNNLQLRVEKGDGTLVVFIEDLSGKVVRRIPENDLWLLTRDKEKSKGNLFDKAM